MDTQLNNDDIEILLKALESLKSKHLTEGLAFGLLFASMADDKNSAKEAFHETFNEGQAKAEALEESITIVEAKLYTIRREANISAASDFLKRGE